MTKRLGRELERFQNNPPAWSSPPTLVGDDMFKWKVQLAGPEGTAYEGGSFTMLIEIPTDYPFKPPTCKFETTVYHPNVKTDTGEICMDSIIENWSPQLKIESVLDMIRQLMTEPNLDQPLEPKIGEEYKNKKAQFDKTVKKYIAKHCV
eukprot:TRINITY_DN4139_c1_g1_i1.p2 TRINITY_DN4139_c1_g1~~TRINITY_DN4139_c1_g1_i1.p2  ORF type:complete len:157 (-),score=38.85 TRINITY_DN4139_c1_g1_i1:135-581(-)